VSEWVLSEGKATRSQQAYGRKALGYRSITSGRNTPEQIAEAPFPFYVISVLSGEL